MKASKFYYYVTSIGLSASIMLIIAKVIGLINVIWAVTVMPLLIPWGCILICIIVLIVVGVVYIIINYIETSFYTLIDKFNEK